MNTDQKTCFKCGAEKPLNDFYKHKQMADGHLNKCKECTKHDAHRHRRSPVFRERVLAYDKERGNRQDSDYRVLYKQKNPLVTKARSAVSNALRDGKLTRPDSCSHCHKPCKPHGHHEDYTQPLAVVWLCASCHTSLHAFYDTLGRKVPACI
jgi:hypothetical protein